MATYGALANALASSDIWVPTSRMHRPLDVLLAPSAGTTLQPRSYLAIRMHGSISALSNSTATCAASPSPNCYLTGVTFNGQSLNRGYTRDAELCAGDELRFTMGPTPNKTRASDRHARPFLMSMR